jgi:DNA-binding winged helix-turn-helix (wHTH) protein/TolB-like protein/Flp pilus assembly protein TadD
MEGSAPYLELPGFVLDVRRRVLLRRESGDAVAINAKAFDLLLYLAQHPGEVLDKDTLMGAVWPGVIVEENSLAQNVSTLRQALGETHGENRFIATVPRRGYRFVAEVRPVDELPAAAGAGHVVGQAPPSAGPPARRGWWLAAGLALLLAVLAGWWYEVRERAPSPSGIQALAVLPFKPLVPSAREESLELGMTDSLIARLSELDGHVVRPLSSVRRFNALDQDPLAAGRALEAQVVLDGTLQRIDSRLRVTARLLDVNDGRQIWAGSFDEDFTTIFDVQDTITQRVSEALRVPLSDRAAPRRERGSTQNPAAYLAHANGRLAWSRLTEHGMNLAITEFDKALALDPHYALAYVGLADSYATLGVFGLLAPRDSYPRAREAVQKALEIEPDLAAAIATLGHITVQYDLDWVAGIASYDRAIAIDPDYGRTYHWRGISYSMHGETERALSDFERARQREPLWIAPRAASGNALFYARRYREALAVLNEALALDERADNARTFRARTYLHSGQVERALTEFLELRQRDVRAPGSMAGVGQALAMLGRTAEARAELARLQQLATQRYVSAMDIAAIQASLGDRDLAFESLERAFEDRATNIGFLEYEPSFDTLRGDPRLTSLVQRIGARKLKTR